MQRSKEPDTRGLNITYSRVLELLADWVVSN